jgi:hypothetical protein
MGILKILGMSTEKDKELDDFFKTRLKDPVEPAYRENDWGAMEQILEKRQTRRGIVYWLPVLSGVAALLLMFFGWWVFRPKVEKVADPLAKHSINKQDHTGTSDGSKRQPIDQQAAGSATYAKNIKGSNAGGTSGTAFMPSAFGSRRGVTGNSVRDAEQDRDNTGHAIVSVDIQGFAGKDLGGEQTMLSYSSPRPMFESGSASANIVVHIAQPPIILTGSENNKRAVIKTQSAFHPQFAITALAASDINGVNSFQQSKVGSNLGLIFSAGISKRLTISTGAIYSVKPYLTNFGNYHTLYKFPVSPVNVMADCRMLDIPLNIGYQVYNRHQNKISVGTGLSSYLMLHENYTFNYPAAGSYYAYSGPTNYTVPQSKKYFFGVINLTTTYERQLNSKVGITVEPYLKLPLTNIGYSQVKLQSTGVAIGLKWNLNSLTKP